LKVLIRADASPAIGSGHIARCLTLAKALRALGAEVSFACRPLPAELAAQIATQEARLYVLEGEADVLDAAGNADIEALLPWGLDIAQLSRQLPAHARFDWIVVDHYGLDQQWELAARQWATRVAAIDDLANRLHAVDLLLDASLSATEQRYAALLHTPCPLLLGPRYALLREEFQVQARPGRSEVERVLVNFGGMDAAGQTLKALQALQGFDGLQVTAVAGRNNPHWQQLQALIARKPHWQLLSYSTDFARLMAAADLFVGAGGGTTWERAALGLPTVCIAVAGNQEANAQALAAAGVHCYLGPAEQVTASALAEAVAVLLQRADLRQQYAHRSQKLVDGHGAQRLARALAAFASQPAVGK
jgi:UDP-2,4-diacetamido-2,4,6-trideoxy-beta-L-altropyranose hydrolase